MNMWSLAPQIWIWEFIETCVELCVYSQRSHVSTKNVQWNVVKSLHRLHCTICCHPCPHTERILCSASCDPGWRWKSQPLSSPPSGRLWNLECLLKHRIRTCWVSKLQSWVTCYKVELQVAKLSYMLEKLQSCHVWGYCVRWYGCGNGSLRSHLAFVKCEILNHSALDWLMASRWKHPFQMVGGDSKFSWWWWGWWWLEIDMGKLPHDPWYFAASADCVPYLPMLPCV